MSGYTIGEIIIWLLLAAILGFILGWLLRQAKYQRARSSSERSHGRVAPAKAAALSGKVESAAYAKSAQPLAGGKAPSAEYKIKGNTDSMLFHTPDSRSYGQTVAEVWFKTEADARAAGFAPPGTGDSAQQASAAKKAPAKTAPAAKKAPAASAPAAKKAPAKTAPAKKAPAKTAPAKNAPAAKKSATTSVAKKAPAKKVAVAAAPAAKKSSAAKKAPAAKKSASRTAAKKAPAKKAPAKKAVAAGRFPGSAQPLSGGRAPSAQYKIKGNEDSMIYHTPDSPFYGQTIAETWFKTEAAAEAAGFRKPKNP